MPRLAGFALVVALAVSSLTGCILDDGMEPYDIKVDWTTENAPANDLVTARVFQNGDWIETHGWDGTARVSGETPTTVEVCVELGHYETVADESVWCQDCESYEFVAATERLCQTVTPDTKTVTFRF